MSSTDEKLYSFYIDHLLPLAAKLKSERVILFPLGFEDTDTWYVDQLEEPYLTDDSQYSFGKQLCELWMSRGRADFTVLADGIDELCSVLEETTIQTYDVSPFIYVMF